jgi:hypothetical protein
MNPSNSQAPPETKDAIVSVKSSPRGEKSFEKEAKAWIKTALTDLYKVKTRETDQRQAEIFKVNKRKLQNMKVIEMLVKMEDSSANKAWSHLHSFSIMSWLKKHKQQTTKMQYLYTPEEVQKHLDLKRIFEVFDEDHSETLDLDEFVEMFIQNYITKYYSSHQRILETSFFQNTGGRGEEDKELISNEDIQKVRRFLEERFCEIFKEATEDDHLFLPEFISLALNDDAKEKYSNVIRELRRGDFLKEDQKSSRREDTSASLKKKETGQ